MRKSVARTRSGIAAACPCVVILAALATAPWHAAVAAGTAAGTVIETRARVEFDIGNERLSLSSNYARVTVDERIDVAVTARTLEVTASSGSASSTLLFTLANTGNGSETFHLSVDNALTGDDFDPQSSAPGIYFDTDASGTLTIGDIAYAPGVNDPLLNADDTISVLVVNDIPAGLADGSRGQSELRADATETGQPGLQVPGAGDGGVNAVIGSSGGSASAISEYLVSAVALSVIKSVIVVDPFGGASPLPGATLTYSVDVAASGGAMAGNAVFTDPIPQFTSYVPGTLRLNGQALTDAADTDAGEYDPAAAAVVVALGDMAVGDDTQTIIFDVTID